MAGILCIYILVSRFLAFRRESQERYLRCSDNLHKTCNSHADSNDVTISSSNLICMLCWWTIAVLLCYTL